MGRTQTLMQRWWSDGDVEALALLMQSRALRSGTRTLNNVVGAYGEYLAWRALGGVRLAQASGEGDIKPLHGRVVEVKATASPRDWRLQYRPRTNDYALVRFDPIDWRVTEAWFVPLAVAQRYVVGPNNTLKARGEWRAKARPLQLNRY
jgi:hypothetical protein